MSDVCTMLGEDRDVVCFDFLLCVVQAEAASLTASQRTATSAALLRILRLSIFCLRVTNLCC